MVVVVVEEEEEQEGGGPGGGLRGCQNPAMSRSREKPNGRVKIIFDRTALLLKTAEAITVV